MGIINSKSVNSSIDMKLDVNINVEKYLEIKRLMKDFLQKHDIHDSRFSHEIMMNDIINRSSIVKDLIEDFIPDYIKIKVKQEFDPNFVDEHISYSGLLFYMNMFYENTFNPIITNDIIDKKRVTNRFLFSFYFKAMILSVTIKNMV